MSIEVTSVVWKHSRQKSGGLLVLLALADYTNAEGVAWPAISTLARKVRMSKRNVQRWVRVLEKVGEVEVRPNQGRKGSNLYRICVPAIQLGTPDARAIRDAGVARGASSTSPTSDTIVAQSVSKPLMESTPVVPTGDETEFWINLCFDCFEQTPHPLPLYVLRKLARDIRFLDRKNADSLRLFYKCEPLSLRKPPYNSRRHSPERLLLHLPSQLGLALQEFPPPPPPKEYPFSLEQLHRRVREEFPDCVLPRSLAELDRYPESIREIIYEVMGKKAEKQ
jgi:hypothetical protein